jgi:hypothetical protein
MTGRVLGFVSLIWCFSAAAGWASTWRCGQEIAKVGDSSAEVLMKCGNPTMREEAATIKRGSWQKGAREREGIDEGSLSRRGTYGETRVRVENWYYDRGMHDFIYKLTFIGGVLTNIRPLRYGGLMKFQEERTPAPHHPDPRTSFTSEARARGGSISSARRQGLRFTSMNSMWAPSRSRSMR